VLFEPTERKSLAGFSPTLHHVLVNELDNVKNRVYVLTRKDGTWTREALPGAPEFGTVTASAVDDEESDDYFMTVTDYLTPTSLSLGAVGKDAPEKLKQLPAFFDAKGLAVSQHEVASKDGTRIPYFQVAREGLALDGKNPTLLYGYGGFELPMVPGYSGGVGSAWLEKGGVYVVANIRGGGEFGPRWHKAALKANRHKGYEDFIAVAEDLVRRRVTSTPTWASRAAATAASSWATCSRCAPTSSAPSCASRRSSTCGATTRCSPARAGWTSTATPTTRRSGRSSRASRRTTT